MNEKMTLETLNDKYEALWDQQDILFHSISEIQEFNIKSKENMEFVLNNQSSDKSKVQKLKYDVEMCNFKLDNMNTKLSEITDLVTRIKEQNHLLQYDLIKIKRIKPIYSYTKWYWFVFIIIVLYIIGQKKQ
jgi:DNA repair ATPase RecN